MNILVMLRCLCLVLDSRLILDIVRLLDDFSFKDTFNKRTFFIFAK